MHPASGATVLPPTHPCPPACLPACQTLERSYLLRVNGKVVERPQHMLMRVSVGIHMEDIDSGVWGRVGMFGCGARLMLVCVFLYWVSPLSMWRNLLR